MIYRVAPFSMTLSDPFKFKDTPLFDVRYLRNDNKVDKWLLKNAN